MTAAPVAVVVVGGESRVVEAMCVSCYTVTNIIRQNLSGRK